MFSGTRCFRQAQPIYIIHVATDAELGAETLHITFSAERECLE